MKSTDIAAVPLTMSTLEIAGLTGKAHKNVLADARKLSDALKIGTADFSAVYMAENGQSYEVINLPKRECLILVSGYSVEMRARIIDRWLELEAALAAPPAVIVGQSGQTSKFPAFPARTDPVLDCAKPFVSAHNCFALCKI